MTCTGECIYFAVRGHQEICYSLALPSFSHCSTSRGPYFIPTPTIPKQIYLQALFLYIYTPPPQHMHTYCYTHTHTHILLHICYKHQTYSSTGNHKHTLSDIKCMSTHDTLFLFFSSFVLFFYCLQQYSYCELWIRLFNNIAILPFSIGPQSLHDGGVIAPIYSTKWGIFLHLRKRQNKQPDKMHLGKISYKYKRIIIINMPNKLGQKLA